jgi:hypothetical protein
MLKLRDQSGDCHRQGHLGPTYAAKPRQLYRRAPLANAPCQAARESATMINYLYTMHRVAYSMDKELSRLSTTPAIFPSSAIWTLARSGYTICMAAPITCTSSAPLPTMTKLTRAGRGIYAQHQGSCPRCPSEVDPRYAVSIRSSPGRDDARFIPSCSQPAGSCPRRRRAPSSHRLHQSRSSSSPPRSGGSHILLLHTLMYVMDSRRLRAV